MKKYMILLLGSLCAVLLGGCTEKEDIQMPAEITDMNIPAGDVKDFYYTYENINYNASYQRYRFYTEDGRYMFFHETREKPGSYGWLTEEDITASGSFEIGENGWAEVMELLKDGTVREREDLVEDGDSGPWMYIYWKGDEDKYQEYKFGSYGDQKAFEEYCRKLAKKKH